MLNKKKDNQLSKHSKIFGLNNMDLNNMGKECIAVIPARGGSKRIPKKNIRLFFGKPIIAYTIEAAKKSGLFSQVIVSTDDKEIAEIANRYGAEVPFLRDSNIADDLTPVSVVTLDALNRLEEKGHEIYLIAQLMANCPLRDEQDIIDSYNQFIRLQSNSQISVTRYGWLNPWWAMIRDENYSLSPVFHDQMEKRSQDLPDLFCPTGAIWWIKAEILKKEKTFHVVNETGWEIPWDHAIDIDTKEDWKMAEILSNYRQRIR